MTIERRIPCFLLEYTGMMSKFHEWLSSPVYRRVDNGARMHVGWNEHPHFAQASPGAIYRTFHGHLVIRTPGGDWHPEGRWQIEGETPNLTIRPSIFFKWGDPDFGETPKEHRRYHAYLTNGVLEELDDTWALVVR